VRYVWLLTLPYPIPRMPWAPGPIRVPPVPMDDRTGRDYAARVRGWLNRVRSRGSQGADAHELTARLDAQLIELRHADEELRLQGEALSMALAEANRERRRYQELFQAAPVAYLTTDVEGRIRDINSAAARLLHIPPSQAPGRFLPAFVRDPAGITSRLARLSRMEQVEDWSTEIVRRDGQGIPVELSAAAVDGAEDETSEILWLLRDIRYEHAAQVRERELHQEQAARAATARVAERARQLADMSGQLMGILDPAAVWTTASTILEDQATAVVLLEFEPRDGGDVEVRVRGIGGTLTARRRLEALRDRGLDLGQAGEALRIPVDLLAHVVHAGEPQVVPAARGDAGPDAAGGPVLVVPLRGRNTILGALVMQLRPDAYVGEEMLMHRHLSDRIALALETAQLFQEVVLARRQSEEAGAAEADFLSMISHELRTPLTAIVSYAELLQERIEELPHNLRRYARQIAAAAHHQRELVEQILSYKGLQREPPGGDPEELDFRDVANFAIGLVRPQVEDRPIELETDLPPIPVRGTCDAGKLRQILANLLANAVRHTEEGHVRLSLTLRDPWVELRVQDTGEGIPVDEVARIYDRFWRGASARAHAGSGLGLTIVRELVTRMHGDVRVNSEPGVGTTFTVRLPRVAPPRGLVGPPAAGEQ
jgi:PAS domain S-box-containing protein